MHRPPRRLSPPNATTPTRAGRITPADVDRAADALLRAGHRPTIERVRQAIGRGSPNTINPLLDAWWQRLAGRLDAGPAALHRLPEAVLHAAEGLWLMALDDARRRAQAEQGNARSSLARERQELAVRSHVLSIRESELKTRLEQAERRTGQLELEVETLTTLLRKEQASRLAAEGRLLTRPSAPRRRGRATAPTAAQSRRLPARKAPSMNSRKAATKATRGTNVHPSTLKGSRR
jgi:hypothetical protein